MAAWICYEHGVKEIWFNLPPWDAVTFYWHLEVVLCCHSCYSEWLHSDCVGHINRQVGSFEGSNYIWCLVCGFTDGEEGCDKLLHALVLLWEQVHLNVCKFLCRIFKIHIPDRNLLVMFLSTIRGANIWFMLLDSPCLVDLAMDLLPVCLVEP